MAANKLALGTAQFGQAYGIANTSGQVSPETATQITSVARNAGIDTLDTAAAYGSSESCLGGLGTRDFKIVTKLPPIPAECRNALPWVEQQVKESCKRLRTNTLYGLLLHRSEDLFGPHQDAILDAFTMLKRSGVVQKAGISIYSPEELPPDVSNYPVDLVQAPLNLVDRRLVTSGWLQRLYNEGIEVHTRSAFLQGLLLMPRKGMPQIFLRWSDLWRRWHAFLDQTGIAPSLACLSYPLSLPQVSRVVVGVDNAEQLGELIAIAEQQLSISTNWPNIDSFDENLINPSKWSLN